MTAGTSTSTVLVLGGVGFQGRHFVHYLVKNELADVCVVDKMLPKTAYFSDELKESFSKVDFVQKNMNDPVAIADCMTRNDGKEFDYVFNFACETKYSQASEVYQERICNLALKWAQEAARRKVKVFVQMSTAEVYESNQSVSSETSRVKPWTQMAEYQYKAEEELKRIEGLNLVILRPALMYGPGAQFGLTIRLMMGRIYQSLNEEMKLLWSKDSKINTVHVKDVARAAWHAATWYVNRNTTQKAADPVPIFNLADKQDTDQGKLNELWRDIFGIKAGFHNEAINSVVRMNYEATADQANEMHVSPWSDLLARSNRSSSLLTPYLDKEFLYDCDLSVDGTKIERITGFEYSIPLLIKERLLEIIDEFKALDLWPKDE